MKKKYILIIFLLIPFLGFSQQTAGDFFKTISENYGKITSYTAHFKLTSGLRSNIIQNGTISYMRPNLLRLDYEFPKNQVLCVNNEKMLLYVPSLGTLYEQSLGGRSAPGTAGLTPQGLTLFITNYSISYLNTPNLEALDENNPELVYKLRLIRRKSSEPFRRIIMSITANGYIRRLESLKNSNELLIMDIVDMNVNANLGENYFDYEAPPTASAITDFLFTPGDE